MSFEFDALKYSYASRRSLVYGRRGMVSTSQPLAAQAGLDIIKKGGNAVDAAIATAICMTVLEPTSNGIGSDCFALVWVKDKLYGLNASGHAPELATPEYIKEQGYSKMPVHGWTPVTVPGAVSGWVELSKRFGKLEFEELFEPAIYYAENGYPVSPVISKLWQDEYEGFFKDTDDSLYDEWKKVFMKNGKTPSAGEVWTLKDHAKTLREIAKTKGESFYRGDLADKIDEYSKNTGGILRKEDLAKFKAEWVEPIKTSYKGFEINEIPPNGHGIVALMALNIMEGFDVKTHDDADSVHKQIEAMKLAFVDGQRYISDPRYMKVTKEELLSKEYAKKRRKLICHDAIMPECGNPSCGGTVYLCTADGEGNMVSFIQSNYCGFGSGVVVPGTGIALHNRGNNFNLDENSENCIEPNKKPYHTIIPGFLTKDNKPIGPFGVMGGFMQPQGHLQVIMNMIDFKMNPQEALDAPRWQWIGEKKIQVERAFPFALTEELLRRGHEITVLPESTSMGRGQIILRDENGTLVGASEPRTDGFVAAW